MIICDIVRYIPFIPAILLSCGCYIVSQQDHYDSADECDEKYPGSHTCDDLRDSGDNYCKIFVSAYILTFKGCNSHRFCSCTKFLFSK